MTFNLDAEYDRLDIATGRRDSPVATYAAGLIHELAEAHRRADEAEAREEAQNATLKFLRNANSINKIVERTIAAGVDHHLNDYADEAQPEPEAPAIESRWQRAVRTARAWFLRPHRDPVMDRIAGYDEFANGSDDAPLSRRERHLNEIAEHLCDEIDERNVLLSAVVPHIDRVMEPGLYERVLSAIAQSEIGANQS